MNLNGLLLWPEIAITIALLGSVIFLVPRLYKKLKDVIKTSASNSNINDDTKKTWVNAAEICLIAVCILAIVIGIIILLCSLPASKMWTSFDFIKNLEPSDWIGIWTSFIDIAISIVMTYLIFNYDKTIQNAQEIQAGQETARIDFERKQGESRALTQWASAMNFEDCIISKVKYRHPTEITLLNDIKKYGYNEVTRLTLISKTPLPVFLKFEVEKLTLTTIRYFCDGDNETYNAEFEKIEDYNEIVNEKKSQSDIDCLFQFYSLPRKENKSQTNPSKVLESTLETKFEFYLFYDSNIVDEKLKALDALLFYQNDFEHISRMTIDINGKLTDTSGYYMEKDAKGNDGAVNFRLHLTGRVLLKDDPRIEIVRIEYAPE